MDETLIRIDEGHIFSDEDYVLYIKWKINDLIIQCYSEEVILFWENNELWYYYVEIFLNEQKV